MEGSCRLGAMMTVPPVAASCDCADAVAVASGSSLSNLDTAHHATSLGAGQRKYRQLQVQVHDVAHTVASCYDFS